MANVPTNPRVFVIRDDVEIVLKKDKGSKSRLESYEVKDFTKEGDNYACIVTSIAVKYLLNDTIHDTTYVVKINPQKAGLPPVLMQKIFEREFGFYEKILPQLNAELEKVGEPKLRMPKYLHSSKSNGKQVIYMEDLRKSGYKMHPRHESLDKAHTMLIVKELSRLHSSSYLVLNKEKYRSNKVEIFQKNYPFSIEVNEIMEEAGMKTDKIYTSSFNNAANLIDGLQGYEYAVKYLRNNRANFHEEIKNISKPNEPFIVFCHGDCWTNNLLFRYSPQGDPIECRLLDLQAYKLSSGSLDLNFLLYTSICGEVRKSNLQTMLDSYYATFASVLSKTVTSMPFTLPQFIKDFHSKNKFGLLKAVMLVPTLLLKPEDAPKIEDLIGEDVEEKRKRHGEKLAEKIKSSPLLKPRLLETLDEFKECGIFNSVN